MQPVIILMAPQMGENIGAVARAMKNFAFTELRLVKPRDGWPNDRAIALAAGATDILQAVKIYDDLPAAINDLTYVYATSASKRAMNIDDIEISQLRQLPTAIDKQHRVGIIFGRENCGLTNEEMALTNKVIYIATNPAFSSLNIAQAVLLVCYQLSKDRAADAKLADSAAVQNIHNQSLANKAQLTYFYKDLFDKLDNKKFFRTSKNKQHMILTIQNMFNKLEHISVNELQILRGIISSLSKTIDKVID